MRARRVSGSSLKAAWLLGPRRPHTGSMTESGLLRWLVDAGGPVAAACLQWVMTAELPADLGRVDVAWPRSPLSLS